MSNYVFNVLNGDSLKKIFPKTIPGEILVARECLVDGPVSCNSVEELFELRSHFISKNFPNSTKENYFNFTVSQFKSISKLPKNSEINLWFEDDLFCQVNMWFTLTLLKFEQTIYLIRPKKETPYSFGHMSQDELVTSFRKKIEIKSIELEKLKQLWSYYQKNDIENLKLIGQELSIKYPFLLPAIEAHDNRLTKNNNTPILEQQCLTLINELNTKDFVPFFKAFTHQFGIYGFGDVQVKNFHKEIIEKFNL